MESIKGKDLNKIDGFISHYGKPRGNHECSKCRKNKPESQFSYYSKRVDKNDYLMRSNALCSECTNQFNKERKETMKKDKDKIPEKPEDGSICPNCNRAWGSKTQPRNWHRDHDAIKHEFRGWICGDCNMAKHDHRHNLS